MEIPPVDAYKVQDTYEENKALEQKKQEVKEQEEVIKGFSDTKKTMEYILGNNLELWG